MICDLPILFPAPKIDDDNSFSEGFSEIEVERLFKLANFSSQLKVLKISFNINSQWHKAENGFLLGSRFRSGILLKGDMVKKLLI